MYNSEEEEEEEEGDDNGSEYKEEGRSTGILSKALEVFLPARETVDSSYIPRY